MKSNRRFRAVLAGLLVVTALMLASCAQGLMAIDMRPRAWVGGPPDGSEVPWGPVTVMCHGYAGDGITQLELWVNGAFANRATNTAPDSQYFTARMTFETTGPGTYVVHCRTYGGGGDMVQSDPVNLMVTGEEPTPTTGEEEIPTATPTATEAPPTEVPPTSTSVPPTPTQVPPTSTRIPPTSTRIPPTSTPLPPSPTREPPRITTFEVSKSQITLGECVTFSYVVAGSPDAIFFDGQGVGGPSGSVDRCPTVTREFELTAQVGGQVVDRASVTVVVIQPSPSPGDTQGPAIGRWAVSPTLIYWNEYDNCPPIETTINAYNVTDPSSVSAVKVVYRMNGGSWQSKGMTQTQTGQYSATIGPSDLERSLDPPVTYDQHNNSLECYVQAFDGVGNQSQVSSRTVTVQYCVTVR
jgi:hypothetical protein